MAMRGGALLSFSFGKKGGAAEVFEIGSSNRRMGELPLFPLLIRREGADVPPFPKKETTHDLSHNAAFDACRSRRARWIRSNPGRACPCPVLGLAQQRSASCVAQARVLLSVY